jgi:hypothetical protein
MSQLESSASVAEHITTRLAQVLIANGAETDLGARVYRGRHNINDDVVPCVVVFEGPDSPVDQPGRTMTNVQVSPRYVLAAYVPCNPDSPNDAAHAAVRDMKRALFRENGQPNANFGGRVRKVTYKGRDIGPRADGVPIVFVTVDIVVDFVEDLANP